MSILFIGCVLHKTSCVVRQLKSLQFNCAVQSGPDERSIPGNTIAVQADMPFSGLTTFGSAFLSKFQCSQMPHPVRFHPITNRKLYDFFRYHRWKLMALYAVSCLSTSHLWIRLEFSLEKNNERNAAMILLVLPHGLQQSVTSFFFCLILINSMLVMNSSVWLDLYVVMMTRYAWFWTRQTKLTHNR